MNREELFDLINTVYTEVAVKKSDFIPATEESTKLIDMGVDSLDFSIGVIYLAEYFSIPTEDINTAWQDVKGAIKVSDMLDYFENHKCNTSDKSVAEFKEFVCQ